MYLCELVWYTKEKQRLTELTYKVFKGGVYSSELQEVLEKMDKKGTIDYFTDKRNNTNTRIYVDREEEIEKLEIEQKIEKLVVETRNSTSGISSDKLVKWSKETVEEKDIKYGEYIMFEKFDKESLKESLINNFPNLETYFIEYN